MKNGKGLNIPLGKPKRGWGDLGLYALLGLVVSLWVAPSSLASWLFVLCLGTPVAWVLIVRTRFFDTWQRRSRYLPLVWLIRCLRAGLVALLLESEPLLTAWLTHGWANLV